jgi:hypothetical protein
MHTLHYVFADMLPNGPAVKAIRLHKWLMGLEESVEMR